MKVYKAIIFILFSAAFLFSAAQLSFADPEEAPTAWPNPDLLVEAEDLPVLLLEPDVVLVDMRAEGFAEGHIPGAVWFGGIPALVNSTHEIEQFLVDADAFQQLMRTIGVRNDSRIIVYDEGNGLGASRLFYALSLYGHEQAAVVNGGIAAWKALELPLEKEAEIPIRGNFTVNFDESRSCDITFLLGNLERDDLVVLDARSPEEFDGSEVRSERGGHIPGAVNLEWRKFVLDGEDIPFFRSPDEIAALLADNGITPDKEVVTHCQSNVRGSHAFFTLRLMGYDSVRAYEGSWFEWGNRADTPVTGSE
ncbi:thiosulfate/3-mercaptopyruvate sulfurtransferase [Cyclonatronum proteinivorum]|uniref:Sulfurtransferase n=1 Tax=Cyclonatronum proteinivorum TaxID=1457365 RepID=A0A345UHG3_9BACT|nr:sulfurtransferase [Cyclonatronum proteinivorum]AXI99914.1 thiosulfate/3-mercaptopyruvate sulfurtransferase [Cyclonatronum proteinivorum]